MLLDMRSNKGLVKENIIKKVLKKINGFLLVHNKDLDLVNNKYSIKNISTISNPLWPVNIQPIKPIVDDKYKKYCSSLFFSK